ncbi:transglycosylase domain-containing protein [Nocardioides albus]|uniref:Membrane peptidoglycan carboxypeptidase n=1 Tax=Nocardioides albus TaxID=1841 RepID=A0A7W5A1U5_9ACTN|nr:transglycosylase domain-containing protein [Nocardioides albus]MBB3087794.1 membrane peptidoglycan carboxypeptidase [Nocardioides albus]GGU20350.1 carboxypeptidase [Nocardioides albus]
MGRDPKSAFGADDGGPLDKKALAARIGKIAAIGALVLALIGSAAVIISYNMISIPSANAAFEAESSFVYYAGGKKEIGRFQAGDQNRDALSPEEMPALVKDAAVAAEDRSFYENNGIDLKGIARTLFTNATTGSQGGASTITQQYVKNLYLSAERTYSRKVKEAVVSLKISRQHSKDEILTGYLNTVYFGRGAYGVQTAAKTYFRKSAKDLNIKEAAALTAILNNPNGFDPEKAGEDAGGTELLGRYQYVLKGMAELKSQGKALSEYDEATLEKAKESLPKFPKPKADSRLGGQKGHVLTLVKNELKSLKNEDGEPLFTEEEIDSKGLKVTTTLSAKAMKASEDAVRDVRPEDKKAVNPKHPENELHVGAATVDVKTGALKGFYGGQDYLESQINWAASGGMAGSTMKPFTLAAALEAGYSLKDTWTGEAGLEYAGGGEVRNSGQSDADPKGHSYGEHITGIKAMEESVNTSFVQMSAALPNGSEDVYEMAVKAGLPPDEQHAEDAPADYRSIPAYSIDFDPKNYLLTLGRQAISPINMANGFATIANGGVRNTVHVVSKVVDAKGEVVYEWDQRDGEERAMSEDAADDTSYALQQVVENGTGKTAGVINQPAAGKTGTATNAEDDVSSAWFAGYTPQLATAVMYVRGKGSGKLDDWLDSYYGAGYPAETWAAIMGPLTDDLELEEFPEPAWMDGIAPQDGHEPSLTATPEPTPTPSEDCSKKDERKKLCIPIEEPEETQKPTDEPTDEWPGEETTPDESESTDPEVTETACDWFGDCESSSPPADGNNGGGNNDTGTAEGATQ